MRWSIRLANHKILLLLLPLVFVTALSATLQECNNGQNANNTTGGCGSYTQSEAFVYVKAPPPTIMPFGSGNYTFSYQYCVPFNLVSGNYIPWTSAMSGDWKFWVSVIDENQNCSQQSRFIFQNKFCGNPVVMTEQVGNTISYPGGYSAYNELLYVPIATNKPLRFTVTAVTNCSLCVCSDCPTTPYTGNNAWQFTNQVTYDAGEVAAIASSNYPNFTAGQLHAINPIYFNCNSPAVICP